MKSRKSKYEVGKVYHSGAVKNGKIVEVDFKCIGYDENGFAKFDIKVYE